MVDDKPSIKMVRRTPAHFTRGLVAKARALRDSQRAQRAKAEAEAKAKAAAAPAAPKPAPAVAPAKPGAAPPKPSLGPSPRPVAASSVATALKSASKDVEIKTVPVAPTTAKQEAAKPTPVPPSKKPDPSKKGPHGGRHS